MRHLYVGRVEYLCGNSRTVDDIIVLYISGASDIIDLVTTFLNPTLIEYSTFLDVLESCLQTGVQDKMNKVLV